METGISTANESQQLEDKLEVISDFIRQHGGFITLFDLQDEIAIKLDLLNDFDTNNKNNEH